jgi:hypothetical protein
MNFASTLALTERQHQELHKHLFPGDGFEAAVLLLCSEAPLPRKRLIVRKMVLVPHAACERREHDYLTWPGSSLIDAIAIAEQEDLSLMLVHSHPGGLFAFSAQDDRSDQVTIASLLHGYGTRHGSAIMTPNGAMLARLYEADMAPQMLDAVSVVGNDLRWWWRDGTHHRRPLAFTSAARGELSRLVACVIGVSGTGSVVAEQLARMGFGLVLLIDHDRVEEKNLNRILNSTLSDAATEQLKVHVVAKAITAYRGEGVAVPLPTSIATREGVLIASQADVIFSCVDSLDARQIADEIATTFMLPLFDVGVTIPTRRSGGEIAIADVCGRVDYVQPGGATLRDRGVYSAETLRAEYLHRVAPETHAAEVKDGYLKGISEQAPSVIALNMRAASACVMEFIARAFPFRHSANEGFARTQFSLAGGEEMYTSESDFDTGGSSRVGRGSSEPLLGMPALRKSKSRNSK